MTIKAFIKNEEKKRSKETESTHAQAAQPAEPEQQPATQADVAAAQAGASEMEVASMQAQVQGAATPQNTNAAEDVSTPYAYFITYVR